MQPLLYLDCSLTEHLTIGAVDLGRDRLGYAPVLIDIAWQLEGFDLAESSLQLRNRGWNFLAGQLSAPPWRRRWWRRASGHLDLLPRCYPEPLADSAAFHLVH
jgi:hypothetical protein